MTYVGCLEAHPYVGRTVALTTKHGKEAQIARPLHTTLNIEVYVPPNLDTDVLGTFTGEIPRPGPPSHVVVQKARMGMAQSGLALGLANEGSFGPHPASPMLIADTELLVWVDDERGIQVQEALVSEQVVAAHCTARSLDELETFLIHASFPSHAVIVRPNRGISDLSPEQVTKGITDPVTLAKAIKQSVALSQDGLACIESDLRAHMNPTRRRVIRRLAGHLAYRLACLCPRCETPGWGKVDVVRGLPCEWCGEETSLVREEVLGCPSCSYQAYRPRSDGQKTASAAQCPCCNP